jgi:4Fe-4S binding domain
VPAALVATYCAVPVLGIIWRSASPTIVWLFIAWLLPFSLVVFGFHYWRNICPLYFFSHIPALLGIQRKRRPSLRFEKYYYYVNFGFLVAFLWLRLIAMDKDGYSISLFFVLIASVAFATGALFTGRTWCNYYCPVSIVEKIYTEGRASIPKRNSQCATCTACKSACPDINPASGYLKEMGLPSKRIAYFGFPGLGIAFYLYFYYQTGIWTYHLSSRFGSQPGLMYRALDCAASTSSAVGHFLQGMPYAAAAAVALSGGAFLSITLFMAIETATTKFLDRRGHLAGKARVRHILFGTAATAAFLICGGLASEAALRSLDPAIRIAGALPVCLAALVIARRFTSFSGNEGSSLTVFNPDLLLVTAQNNPVYTLAETPRKVSSDSMTVR